MFHFGNNKVLHETSQPTTTEYVEKRTFMEAVLKLEALDTKLKFLSCKLNDGKEDIDADNTEEVEDTKDKISSFKDVRKEAKAFVKINGYSKLLSTNVFFKKIFWLICWFPLLGYCIYLSIDMYQQYRQFDVVTQIKVNEEIGPTFPAVTICLSTYGQDGLTPLNISNMFLECSFEGKICIINDFINYQIRMMDGKRHNCYQINTGRNADNQQKDIYKTNNFGLLSGLTITLYLNDTEDRFN